jgi:hypothetical protein
MTPGIRKLVLTAHVVSSVGWLGAIAGFLALALVGLTSQNAQTVRGAYLVMEPAAWFVLVPLAFLSLVTGLVQSFGTAWGLFRHYWVSLKTSDQRHRHDRLAPLHGDFPPHGQGGRRSERRSRPRPQRFPCAPRGCRPPASPRGDSPGRVQASGHDAVRTAQGGHSAGHSLRSSRLYDQALARRRQLMERPLVALLGRIA